MESGVNFFDTADVYSNGLSEQILGQAIKHLPRESLLISTKTTFGFDVDSYQLAHKQPNPNAAGSSRSHILQQVEGSLKRLGTDYIDIYHMHAFDALTPIDEVLNILKVFLVG
jgi:aryl-alcohol dehydrogenase-like predicted oxidoreductase